MSAFVKHGRNYQGVHAFEVVNPDGERLIPGRTVLVIPAHEEAPAWRAILAGYDAEGNEYVVPLQGHFGELKVNKYSSKFGGRLCLAQDEPHAKDECDWEAAKVLALSVGLALGLGGRA